MSNKSHKFALALTVTVLAVGLLWLLFQPSQTGLLSLQASFTESSNISATTTLHAVALRKKDTKKWHALGSLTSKLTTGNTTGFSGKLSVGNYDRLRFSLTTPRTRTTTGEPLTIHEVTSIFEVPFLVRIDPQKVSRLKISVPVTQSFFSTESGDYVFLPQFSLTSTAETRLVNYAKFGTAANGQLQPLFSYPQNSVFSIEQDRTITIVDTNSSSSTTSEN